MKEKLIELIGYDLPIMRLLVEGAIALFEDEWDDNPKETADTFTHICRKRFTLIVIRFFVIGMTIFLNELFDEWIRAGSIVWRIRKRNDMKGKNNDRKASKGDLLCFQPRPDQGMIPLDPHRRMLFSIKIQQTE